jgi:HlyD family secretion protein
LSASSTGLGGLVGVVRRGSRSERGPGPVELEHDRNAGCFVKYLKAFALFALTLLFVGLASLVRPLVSSSLGKPSGGRREGGRDSKAAAASGLQFGYERFIPKVEVSEVGRGSVAQSVSAPGSLSPGSDVSVGADFPGVVLGLYVDEGDTIQKGEPLFELDPTEKRESKEEAEVNLKLKQLALEEAQAEADDAKRKLEERIEKGDPSTVKEARLALRKSEIAMEQNQARLENAESKTKRAKLLLEKGLGTEVEVESAESELRVAKLTMDIGSKDLQLARDNLSFQIEEAERQLRDLKKASLLGELRLKRATKDLRLGEVALTRASRDLDKCRIIAPISGVVTKRSINSGEAVNRNDLSVVAGSHYIISDFSRMYVYADVDEGDIVQVRVDQPVKVRINALGDNIVLDGKVIDIGNRAGTTANSESLLFRVRVLILNAPPSLRPGMTANVEIETKRADDVVTLSVQAVGQRRRRDIKDKSLLPSEEGKSNEVLDVVFIAKDGKAEMRVVKLGVADDDKVEIVSGITSGDQVIVGPYKVLESLGHQDPVQVEEKKEEDGGGRDKKRGDGAER